MRRRYAHPCTFVIAALVVGGPLLAAEPKPLPAPVNSAGVDKDPWLCPDGNTLLFASNRDGGDFNIYQTRWTGQGWTPPEKLSEHINSKYDDWSPSVSDDGRLLLFLSLRGGQERSAWLSRRVPDGAWGPAHLVRTKEYWGRGARISGDGRTVFYIDNPHLPDGTRKITTMRVDYDPRTRFWFKPQMIDDKLPENNVPGARWRFSEKNDDIWGEELPWSEPADTDKPEYLRPVGQSSMQIINIDFDWVTDAQNLIDGFEDTGWASRAGAPVNQQWVLFALNGRIFGTPGESRIHSLKIHAGPVAYEGATPPPGAGPGTRPNRLRILGGMQPDTLTELAVADLKPEQKSPWHTIKLNQPARIRYLKIEVLGTVDAAAPFVGFNEVQVFGSGESARPAEHVVAKDANNNITVDGRPFFPLYLYNTLQGDMDNLARWGFNTILGGDLEEAYAHGLMVISGVPAPDDPLGRIVARRILTAGRHHPALLGYLMSDESGSSEEMMQLDERRAAYIKKYDPHHFTALNDLWPKDYPRSAKIVDVFSIDPYPQIVGQPYSYQADAVDAAGQAVNYAKPVMVVNASWHGGGGRLVSPQENRLVTYLALIHGAKGISWYAIEFSDAGQTMGIVWDYPDHWNSILRCVDEIRQLEPVLFAPGPKLDSPLYKAARIDNPNARIDVLLKEVGGEVWMLAANCEPKPVTAAFSFGWGRDVQMKEVMNDLPQERGAELGGSAAYGPRSYFEFQRTIRQAKPFRLAFDTYQVRVFRMKPAGAVDFHYAPAGRGEPLAVANESIYKKLFARINEQVTAKKVDEARKGIERFWNEYKEYVDADDVGALTDALGMSSAPQEVLANYGRLIEEHPEALGWPHWVFKIINALAKSDRKDEARPWLEKVIKNRPDSVWRVQAEVLLNPAAAAAGGKPFVKAARLARPPAIDAQPDEALWKNHVAFQKTVNLDPSKKPQNTEFAVGYDAEALYLVVRAVEPEPGKITARQKKDEDRVWEDDSIDFFIDHDLDGYDYQQLAFNTLGVKFDGASDRADQQPYYRQGYRLNAGQVQRKAKVDKDCWYLEVRIPFKDLGVPAPQAGQVWGLGLQRFRHVGGQLVTVWGNENGAPLGHAPENFGFLIFE